MESPADRGTERDWFGHPISADGRRPVAPVPCPFCGAAFTSSTALATHARDAHRVDHDPGRTPAVFGRLATWGRGLRFMPLWFVLLMNAGFTVLLYVAFRQDSTWEPALFSLGDQSGVMKTWILRISILPSVLLLSWRVVGRTV